MSMFGDGGAIAVPFGRGHSVVIGGVPEYPTVVQRDMDTVLLFASSNRQTGKFDRFSRVAAPATVVPQSDAFVVNLTCVGCCGARC
jgi:hypothetical protein